MYEAGQQVVCVDTNWVDPSHEEQFPVLGGVYTISGFTEPYRSFMDLDGSRAEADTELAFRLYEVKSIGGFYHWHFRPVKKTDISEFLKIAKPVNVVRKRELEDA